MPLQIIRQDITKIQVDAIVNTTNKNLYGYSGVDFAIHSAAGYELDNECEKLAPLGKGEAIVTAGYNLNCKYIIHTSGPVWLGGAKHEKESLESCFISCLNAALDKKCETIAFPLISSGEYGYPKDMVLTLAVKIITKFLLEHEMTVYLCVFDATSYEFSKKMFFDIKSYIDDCYVEKRSDIFADIRLSDTVATKFVPQKTEAVLSDITRERKSKASSARQKTTSAENSDSLNEWINNIDDSFAGALFKLIDKKGLTDIECYKKANVSRKTFSKIKCDPNYKPSKQTAVAFAIALNLDLHETQDFLKSAGLSLSHSFKFDIIIEYFITHGKYDVFEINEALFEFDQSLLGC